MPRVTRGFVFWARRIFRKQAERHEGSLTGATLVSDPSTRWL